MSESTWKYSFGKYLELSFWSTELRLRAGVCPHDLHRDHLRYFGFRNVTMRIHYDPVDLLDIVVPRARITWKVDNDLRLKNDLYLKTESKWNIFMASVKSRIGGINIDSVISEKAEACKAEIARLTQRAQDEHVEMLRKLQAKYMESRYYEVIPMNRAIRAMQEKVADWDSAFADLDANFFPSEKDIRRLAALQLKNLFLDRDSSVTSLVSNEASEQPSEQPSEVDEKSEVRKVEDDIADDNTPIAEENKQLELIDEEPTPIANMVETPLSILDQHTPADANQEGLQHLDLAVPLPPSTDAGLALGPMTDGSPESVVDRAQDAAAGQQNILLHPPPERSESEVSLSDKIQQLRKASLMVSPDIPSTFESSIPRPIQTGERSSGRKAGQTVSPPILRTQSQPATTIRKLQKAQPAAKNKDLINSAPLPNDSSLSIPSSSTSDLVKDKKLSERLGLGTLKNGRKAGASLIPRSIQGKKKDSKVSTLAKHFEQLSREFEKERMRDRKQRAAKASRSQAFPRASSKPIVEVYKDVNEAVEERGPSDDALRNVYPSQSSSDITTSIEGLAQVNSDNIEVDTAPPPSTDAGEETATEAETDHHNHDASQTATDDEGMVTDAEQSLGDLPDAAEIADSLGTSEIGTDTELPKHERSSLMKMLSTFWAERSASGWTQLEYPLQSTEHVFADSDVIVREDEPSSLIAFALASKDYTEKLEHIRNQGRMKEPSAGASQPPSLSETDVETSLLRATGTHLKYQFAIGSCKMLCKIFYAEQFDAVRRKCGAADRIIESLSRCLKWDSKGGKTKSVFLKTLDDRLVMKGLSPIETQAFLNFAPAYFGLMAEALFHELPSVIAKMLGFYQIVIKNPATGTEIKLDLLVMENLFYDRVPTRIFDLKGSMRNRKIHSTGEQNEVLLDENMVEFIYESPLFVREHSKKLLKASVWNDTLFLARQNVMDYSLMVAVDEKRKELVVGIIDCIRTYTWDKKLESWIKDRGFGGGGRNRPTVTSPKEYKSRFRLAMDRYVLQAPK
jgi:1-phosphatidylinositol-3-phosphate 5-kinase